MVYLAKNSSREKVVSLREISEDQNISFDFLEKILSELEKAGLVKAKKGSQGGYFLAKKPESIKSLEIIEALEGEVNPVDCGGCPYSRDCSSRSLWEEMGTSLESKLKNVTLSDLIKK